MSDLPALRPVEAAALLQISTTRLRELAQAGILPAAIEGRFQLPYLVQAYCSHLAAQVQRAQLDGAEVLAARARLLEARARAAEAAANRNE